MIETTSRMRRPTTSDFGIAITEVATSTHCTMAQATTVTKTIWATAAQIISSNAIVLDLARLLEKNAGVAHNRCRKDKYIDDIFKNVIEKVACKHLKEPNGTSLECCRHRINNNKLPLYFIARLMPLAARLAHIIKWDVERFFKGKSMNSVDIKIKVLCISSII